MFQEIDPLAPRGFVLWPIELVFTAPHFRYSFVTYSSVLCQPIQEIVSCPPMLTSFLPKCLHISF